MYLKRNVVNINDAGCQQAALIPKLRHSTCTHVPVNGSYWLYFKNSIHAIDNIKAKII